MTNASKSHADVKQKECSHCHGMFYPHPMRSMARACSPMCAIRLARADKKEQKEHDKARADKLKRIPDLIKEAQKEFNAYIRARDAGKPCICCGSPLGTGEVGGAYDCGHYRSTGSASHLRFDERNAHAQRKVCNRWGAGRAVDYRIGLIARIGLQAVESLESSNAPHKWKADELRAIKATYRAKLKDLLKGME